MSSKLTKPIEKYSLSKEWEISMTEFESGGFGSFSGYLARFPRKELMRFKDPVTGKYNITRIFNEIAESCVRATIVDNPILKKLKFKHIPEEETKIHLKRAVYCLIQYLIDNKTLSEMTYNTIMSGNAFSINHPDNRSVFQNDKLGMAYYEEIEMSEIRDYYIVSKGELTTQDPNGNIKILGKVDLEKIPDWFGGK